ncbi:hypothetical protein FOZ63_031982 [Perkinsus olseni]|uniref:Uncharacterized protein n=1 Tax=Perkinsus olseni TaxID=32597 RepID=A0A7J6UJ04_PEROL|nr:hypothetical protein FOZ63_031982 [Perkinsus olseni]
MEGDRVKNPSDSGDDPSKKPVERLFGYSACNYPETVCRVNSRGVHALEEAPRNGIGRIRREQAIHWGVKWHNTIGYHSTLLCTTPLNRML